jgi:hypothetical protein
MVARSSVLRSGDDANFLVLGNQMMPKVWFRVTEATKLYLGTPPCHLGGQGHWVTCPRCRKKVLATEHPPKSTSFANAWAGRLAILNCDGDKPKGMHWKTYQRLKSHHDALVQVSFLTLAASWVSCTNFWRGKSVSQNRSLRRTSHLCVIRKR